MPYKMLNVVATIALGWLVSTGGLAGPSFAQDPQKKLPYPNVTDTSHATNKVGHIFEGFFSAKSLHDGVTMVSFFGPDPVLYIDAGLGFAWPSRAALLQVWTNPPFSTANPDALSYPLRVIGDCHSALIEFVDTPPLLGKEFRFLSSITFNDKCQIVRWIDYWDGRSSQTNLPIGTLRPLSARFPRWGRECVGNDQEGSASAPECVLCRRCSKGGATVHARRGFRGYGASYAR